MLCFRFEHLLDFTTISNVEKSIERFKKQNLTQIPTTLNELHNCFKMTSWQHLLKHDDTDSFTIEFVHKDEYVKAVIFIDKILINLIGMENIKTIFVDGTFATVPKIKNSVQLWTILTRHQKRVSRQLFIILFKKISYIHNAIDYYLLVWKENVNLHV